MDINSTNNVFLKNSLSCVSPKKRCDLQDKKIHYWTALAVCKRESQEDYIDIKHDQEMIGFGVYDGHLGHKVAEQLADNETGLLVNIIDLSQPLTKDLISNAYTKYDEARFKEMLFTGSTAVTFFYDGNQKKIFLAHCGNSQGLLLNFSTQAIIYQTKDHNVSDASEKKRVIDAGGFINSNKECMTIHEGLSYRLGMSRAFGDSGYTALKFKSKNKFKCPEEIPNCFYHQTCDKDNCFYVSEVVPMCKKSNRKVVISKPDIFEAQLTRDPILGVLYSDGFSNFFASDSGEKEFGLYLQKIIFLLINKNARKVKTLAKDLICLMNRDKTLEQITKTVMNDELDFKELVRQSTVFSSEDNIALIIFCLENNSSSIVSDMDSDSETDLDGSTVLNKIDLDEIQGNPNRIGSVKGLSGKQSEAPFSRDQGENQPEGLLKKILKKFYPIHLSRSKVFLVSSLCLGLLAIVYYLKPQLLGRV